MKRINSTHLLKRCVLAALLVLGLAAPVPAQVIWFAGQNVNNTSTPAIENDAGFGGVSWSSTKKFRDLIISDRDMLVGAAFDESSSSFKKAVCYHEYSSFTAIGDSWSAVTTYGGATSVTVNGDYAYATVTRPDPSNTNLQRAERWKSTDGFATWTLYNLFSTGYRSEAFKGRWNKTGSWVYTAVRDCQGSSFTSLIDLKIFKGGDLLYTILDNAATGANFIDMTVTEEGGNDVVISSICDGTDNSPYGLAKNGSAMSWNTTPYVGLSTEHDGYFWVVYDAASTSNTSISVKKRFVSSFGVAQTYTISAASGISTITAKDAEAWGGDCYTLVEEVTTSGDRQTAIYKNATRLYSSTIIVLPTSIAIEGTYLGNRPITSYPYSEGFESGLGDWSTYDLDMQIGTLLSHWNQDATQHHSGTHCAFHNFGSFEPNRDQRGWLISRPMVLQASKNYELSFYDYFTSSADYGVSSVKVSTTDTRPGSFTTVWTKSNPVNNTWTAESINLSAYAGQTIYVAFYYEGYNAHSWRVDDIVMTQSNATNYTLSASCSPVFGGTVSLSPSGGSYPAGTSVTMTATAENGHTFTSWNDGNTSNPRTITVNANATYTANFSDNYTYCSTMSSFPYTEGFENSADWDCWRKVDFHFTNTDWTRTTSSPSPYAGTYCAYSDGTHESDDLALISRPIHLQSGTSYNLSFQTYTTFPQDYRTSRVFVSTTRPDLVDLLYGGSSTWHMLWQENSPAASWREVSIDLSSYAGQTIYIAFEKYGTDDHGWGIDNISIEAAVTEYTITVQPNNPAWGSTTGSGTYPAGTSVTMTATANSGYRFLNWSDGNTSNPRTITVTANATYTANFGEQSVTYYTITTTANPSNGGTVTGGGTYPAGSTALLTAVPNAGYEFSAWQDGNTSNPRTITVNGNATYTANFAQVSYTITTVAMPVAGGTVSGGGSYTYGQHATLTATANGGYSFNRWSDGSTSNPRTVTVTGNATYTAIFTQNGGNNYTITVVPNNAAWGSTTGSGIYPQGSVIQITATANPGFRFSKWDDQPLSGSGSNIRNVTVTGNATYTAVFEALPDCTITVVSDNPSLGTVYGSGTYPVGETVTIGANPTTGNYFTGWNDGNITNPRNIVVTGDATYTASFSSTPVTSYTVTAIPLDPTLGSVIGGGSYVEGSTATIQAIPNDGVTFSKWNDGNTSNPRSFTVNSNMSFIAIFSGAGVDDFTSKPIEVFPNPAYDKLYVNGIEDDSEASVFNVLGMKVETLRISDGQMINISGYAPGVYLIRVNGRMAKFVKK